jgi:hypothetical protein
MQPLNASEAEWLESNLRLASRLAERYTGQMQALPALALLDATLAAWAQAPLAS